MIKLVLSDMDNTLIPFGRGHASERTLRAIHACLDAGVLFGPASGRNRNEVATFLDHDEAAYATGVLVNGQQTYLRGELINEVTLDPSAVRRVEAIVRDLPHCAFIIFRPDGHADWVGDSRDELGHVADSAMLHGDTRHEVLPEYPVVKAGIIALVDRADELALQERLIDACPELDFANTVSQWFDVIPHGWSKADAIDVLREALDISAGEICAFGDAENDLAMFARVGHPCAVANASPEVLAAAKWHVGAAEDDGVAEALEQIAEAARTGGTPTFIAAQQEHLRVVPAKPSQADELRRVCIASASERARTNETHRAFSLLMYCDPYLEHGVAFALEDSEGHAHGYALACEDWRAWEQDTAEYRRKIEELGPEYQKRYADEASFYASVYDEYPAHLHIDIEEEYTGQGYGRVLMEALLARLRADRVRGVVFGVASSNEHAIGFYRHLGFEEVMPYDGGYTFGMHLA